MIVDVLMEPRRLIDKIRYQLFGTLPVMRGELVHSGPIAIELVYGNGDSCHTLQWCDIVDINFVAGYKEAYNSAKQDYESRIANQFNAMLPPMSDSENEMPYPAAGVNESDNCKNAYI
jgi:hypothetical protein